MLTIKIISGNLARTMYLSLIFLSPSAVFADSLGADEAKTEHTNIAEKRQCIASTPAELLAHSFDFDNTKNTDFPIEIPAQTLRFDGFTGSNGPIAPNSTSLKRAPEGGPIVFKLARPGSVSQLEWQNSYVNGVAFIEDPSYQEKRGEIVRVGLSIRDKTADAIVLDAVMPANPGAFASKEWTLISVLCGGQQNKVIGFTSARIVSVSVAFAWTMSAILIFLFWAAISFASWQLNRKKLDMLWNSTNGSWKNLFGISKTSKFLWKCLEASNPIFISQDSLGFGSLARFQILVFTTVVGFVLLYIFVHSGIISNISNTILLLLGVTVAGGTFARATGDWTGISVASRGWLIGRNILVTEQDKPRWSDLFETQGELDVAKVQALLFTGLISIGIFASGYIGLSSFALPDQIVYLSMISQSAYVFGKLLPADTRKKLEEDMEAFRKSAYNAASDPNNMEYRQNYAQARSTARRTLEQTYVDRFNNSIFDTVAADPKNVI